MSSGVTLPKHVADTIENMKLKKLDQHYRWLTLVFKPSIDNPTTLEVGDKGTQDYDHFRNHLCSCQYGCYAVADVPTTTGGSKLVLFSWAPDHLGAKQKMMVASTTAAIKAKVQGVEHYQACDESELELSLVQSKVERKY